jgi:hypothetical protein
VCREEAIKTATELAPLFLPSVAAMLVKINALSERERESDSQAVKV